jgi:fatty acid/phospholipid biosynthesis enzyme
MAESLVLSIDGMGGDHAPDIVVEGVDIAARRSPDALMRCSTAIRARRRPPKCAPRKRPSAWT